MTTSWRVFCAIELSQEVRQRMDEHVTNLRREVPDAAASWSRVENIHLTLKFFGNVALDRIPAISSAAERVAAKFSSFEIEIGETGVFPKPSRVQVLWIGVRDPSGTLAALQKRFEDECEILGFDKEGRAFRPHLTIARLRRPEGARQLAAAHLQKQFTPSKLSINELILFRSELSSKGSRYTAISKHALTA